MNQPTILLWNIPVLCPAHTALTTHPNNKQIAFRHVSAEQTGHTLGSLSGFTAEKTAPALPCSDTPAVVFCGLSEQQLDECLLLLRSCGQKIPLKAVLTPHNQGWKFAKLLQELDAEYQHFQSKG